MRPMKITSALIDKLIRLRNGESVPASSLRGSWVEALIADGVLLSRTNGSRRVLRAVSASDFMRALEAVDERFADLERMQKIIEGGVSRENQAALTGNSKLKLTRTCPGFLVNSYEPILCKLSGNDFMISPLEGSFVFVSDWEGFSIPADVVVVGIENMANFRCIRQQRVFFERELPSAGRLLFVSRYPQSADLRKWLLSNPNRYVHFGDFDLAGINIFLTEFRQYLGGRSSFLIPSDISLRLAGGSAERYQDQYFRFRKLDTEISDLHCLIWLIHSARRCYDQEGYIAEAEAFRQE